VTEEVSHYVKICGGNKIGTLLSDFLSYTTSGLSSPHFRISFTLVTYQSPVLGNFTVDLSPVLRILYFIYPN